MKMANRVRGVVAAVVMLFVAVFAVAFPAPAHAEDGASGKGGYRVAVVSAAWCGPCQLLKAELKSKAELREFANCEFLDADEKDGAAKLREVGGSGIPAIIAIHKTKRAVLIQTGYSGNAKALVAAIRAKLKALNETK